MDALTAAFCTARTQNRRDIEKDIVSRYADREDMSRADARAHLEQVWVASQKPKAQTMAGKAVVNVEEAKRLPVEYVNATIMEADLRPHAMIKRFLEVLSFAWPTKAEWLRVEYGLRSSTDLERWCDPEIDPGVYDTHDGTVEDQKALERRQDDVGSLIADLIDALAEVAPEGCSFGAHEGDGACFGFWEYDDPFDVEPPDEPVDYGNPKLDDLMDEARDLAAEHRREREGEEGPW